MSPNSIGKGADDGDIHMAGRSDQIRLPMVAEIMNAAGPGQAKALAMVKAASGAVPLAVTGIWRIWFEHPASSSTQVQGEPVEVPPNTNPDHVFEVHPIIRFADQDIVASLGPIAILDPAGAVKKQYQSAAAKDAFASYESLGAKIGATSTAVTITSKKAGYNYVTFDLEPVGEIKPLNDGLFVLARVYDDSDPEEPLTESPRRMVFVNGSKAAELLKQNFGQKLKVLGIPRVDLDQVAEIAKALKPGEEAVSVCLPYEIVVLAVFPSEPSQ
jgi:hypothetical protein